MVQECIGSWNLHKFGCKYFTQTFIGYALKSEICTKFFIRFTPVYVLRKNPKDITNFGLCICCGNSRVKFRLYKTQTSWFQKQTAYYLALFVTPSQSKLIAWSDVALKVMIMCSNFPSTGTAVFTTGGNLSQLQSFLSTMWYNRPGTGILSSGIHVSFKHFHKVNKTTKGWCYSAL